MALVGSNASSVVFSSVQPYHAGIYLMVASNRAGVTASLPIKLVVTNGADYVAWTTNLPAGFTGPLDDPDQDGIPNLLEYALSLNPTNRDGQGLPQPQILVTNGQQYLTYTFNRPKSAGDLQYVIETSSQIAPWHNDLQVVQLRTVEQGNTVQVTLGMPCNQATNVMGFLQLKVVK
jgi:hypothetical protein